MNQAQKYQLVLVGKIDYFYNRLKKLVEKENIENVIFLGQITDEILDIIYRQSKAYVFTSLYEGFGIPPLEAMNRNIPVISSDHPCMKEILGDSAYFFNGQEEKEISKAMKRILGDEDLRNNLIEKSLNQIKKYSWEKMAEETLKIYDSAK